MKYKYYVIIVYGDIEPDLHGPFNTSEEQDIRAKELRKDNPEDGIYWLSIGEDGEPEIGAYSGGFFEEEE